VEDLKFTYVPEVRLLLIRLTSISLLLKEKVPKADEVEKKLEDEVTKEIR